MISALTEVSWLVIGVSRLASLDSCKLVRMLSRSRPEPTPREVMVAVDVLEVVVAMCVPVLILCG